MHRCIEASCTSRAHGFNLVKTARDLRRRDPSRLFKSPLPPRAPRAPLTTRASAAAVGAAAAPGLLDSITEALSGSIFQSSMGASFKLLLMCVGVMLLMAWQVLPEETPQVLSKVCFNLFIPCTLITKTAEILAGTRSWALLGVPVAATIQILVGGTIGIILCNILFPKATPTNPRGWGSPSQSQLEIAGAAASAIGVKSTFAAAALLPPAKPLPVGSRELLLLATAFNNSLTLPLIFILSLLTGEAATRASAFVALYLTGWSPLLWGLGYWLLSGLDPEAQKEKERERERERALKQSSGQQGQQGQGLEEKAGGGLRLSAVSGDLYTPTRQGMGGRAATAEPVTLDLPSSSSSSSPSSSSAPPRPKPSPSILKQIFNPPMIAIVAGVIIGISPAGPVLMMPADPGVESFVHSSGPILSSLIHVSRSLVDVLEIFGSATLGVQATVLASSLYQKPEKKTATTPLVAVPAAAGGPTGLAALPVAKFPFPDTPKDVIVDVAEFTVPAANGSSSQASQAPVKKSWAPDWLLALAPKEPVDMTIILASLAVRMTAIPAITFVVVTAMRGAGILPSDPMASFAILLEASMPTAQNLVLLMQLRDFTRPLAERAARLLLIQYTLAIPFVTFWISTWCGVLGIVPSAL